MPQFATNHAAMQYFRGFAKKHSSERFWLTIAGCYGYDTYITAPMHMVGQNARPLDLIAEVIKLAKIHKPETYEAIILGGEFDKDTHTPDLIPMYLNSLFVDPVLVQADPRAEVRVRELLDM